MCLKNDREDLTLHWAKREEKKLRERNRIPKHGKNFAEIYARVVARRAKEIKLRWIRQGRKIKETIREKQLREGLSVGEEDK